MLHFLRLMESYIDDVREKKGDVYRWEKTKFPSMWTTNPDGSVEKVLKYRCEEVLLTNKKIEFCEKFCSRVEKFLNKERVNAEKFFNWEIESKNLDAVNRYDNAISMLNGTVDYEADEFSLTNYFKSWKMRLSLFVNYWFSSRFSSEEKNVELMDEMVFIRGISEALNKLVSHPEQFKEPYEVKNYLRILRKKAYLYLDTYWIWGWLFSPYSNICAGFAEYIDCYCDMIGDWWVSFKDRKGEYIPNEYRVIMVALGSVEKYFNAYDKRGGIEGNKINEVKQKVLAKFNWLEFGLPSVVDSYGDLEGGGVSLLMRLFDICRNTVSKHTRVLSKELLAKLAQRYVSETLFLLAIGKASAQKVLEALDKNLGSGLRVMHIAFFLGDEFLIKTLLNSGADVECGYGKERIKPPQMATKVLSGEISKLLRYRQAKLQEEGPRSVASLDSLGFFYNDDLGAQAMEKMEEIDLHGDGPIDEGRMTGWRDDFYPSSYDKLPPKPKLSPLLSPRSSTPEALLSRLKQCSYELATETKETAYLRGLMKYIKSFTHHYKGNASDLTTVKDENGRTLFHWIAILCNIYMGTSRKKQVVLEGNRYSFTGDSSFSEKAGKQREGSSNIAAIFPPAGLFFDKFDKKEVDNINLSLPDSLGYTPHQYDKLAFSELKERLLAESAACVRLEEISDGYRNTI